MFVFTRSLAVSHNGEPVGMAHLGELREDVFHDHRAFDDLRSGFSLSWPDTSGERRHTIELTLSSGDRVLAEHAAVFTAPEVA